jgi:hypothetical protein
MKNFNMDGMGRLDLMWELFHENRRSAHFARRFSFPKRKEKEKKKASIVWGVACHQLNGS